MTLPLAYFPLDFLGMLATFFWVASSGLSHSVHEIALGCAHACLLVPGTKDRLGNLRRDGPRCGRRANHFIREK
jgi:hypothetical protein